MAAGIIRILGWLVIAHGLSHAVLPMRGSLAPTLSDGDWTPAGLYGISMVGFVAAGMGLLGLRPLDRAISPLLVLASGLSMVAIVRLGDPRLWLGAVCDVALFLLGLWRASAGWPLHHARGRLRHMAGLTVGFGVLSYVTVAAFSYPSHRSWGSTPAELTMPLPGDVERREPALEVQHAVTIDAPPEDVWVWLVQLGQDRGGFYSYDWLERAFGVDSRTVRDVRAEWQTRQAGDLVRATQPTYLGGLLGDHHGWAVREVSPGRALVLEGWGTFVLRSTADGRSRFIIRSTMSDRNASVWASATNLMGVQLPHFIMQRRMMLTIKALAEERHARRAAEDPARAIDIIATDEMQYSITTITADPGERLRIRLYSKGVIPKVAMAHNVVVLEIDTDIARLLTEGAPHRETDFIPPSMAENVIAKTALAGPNEVVEVTFTAPSTPGEYPFVCTFAGHYQAGMKGTLTVESEPHE